MRLLYLSGAPRVSTKSTTETTGARAHVLGVINALKRKGVEVKEYIVGDNISTKISGGGSQKKLTSSTLFRIAADFYRIYSSNLNGKKAYDRYHNNVDVVYERFGAFQSLGRRFKKSGKKWILETNSPLFIEAKSERKSLALASVAKRMEIAAYKDCDILICITQELKGIIVKECGIDEKKILVMPNAVDTAQFNPDSILAKNFFNFFTIGFIGNLYAWAGMDLLLRAIYELKKRGVTVGLVIVGDGMMRSSWEELAKELQISDQVLFTGRLSWDVIPEYMKGFDLAYSGQVAMKMGKMYHSPLKLYEYMAMGKPVLASAFEEAQKLITDGYNGFLYQPGNFNKLVQKIAEIKDLNNFEEIGANARVTIEKNHTWDKRIDDLLGRIKQL